MVNWDKLIVNYTLRGIKTDEYDLETRFITTKVLRLGLSDDIIWSFVVSSMDHTT